MDFADMQSDLHALRKLYGLLQYDREGVQTGASQNLDGKARALLKNLLDGAAERIFETYAQVFAYAGASSTPCSQPQQSIIDRPEERLLPFLADVPNVSSRVGQSTRDFKLQKAKVERRLSKPATQVVASDNSKLGISVSKPVNRKKCCQVCRRNSVKQLKLTEERNMTGEEFQNPNRVITLQHQLRNQPNGQADGLDHKGVKSGRTTEKQMPKVQQNLCGVGQCDCSSNDATTGIVTSGATHNSSEEVLEEPEKADFISKEASDVIQQFKSRITAAKNVGLLEKKSVAYHAQSELRKYISESASLKMQRKKALATRTQPTRAGKFIFRRNDPQNRFTSQRVVEVNGSNQWDSVPTRIVNQFMDMKMPNQPSSIIAKMSPSTGQTIGHNKWGDAEHETLGEVGKSTEGQSLLIPRTSQVPGQNVKAIVEKIESHSQVKSVNSCMPSQTFNFLPGLSAPGNVYKMTSKALPLPTKLPSQIYQENCEQNQLVQEEITRAVGKSQPPIRVVGSADFMGSTRKHQAVNAGDELSQVQTRNAVQSGKIMDPQSVLWKTLVHHKHGQDKVLPESYEDQTNGERHGKQKEFYVHPRKTDMRNPQEPESTSLCSGSSSSWTTQLASTSFSDEEYSLPSQTRSQPHTTTNTGSGEYTSSGKTEGRYMGFTSSESEMYSVGSTSSSERQGYLPSDQSSVHSHSDSTHRTVRPTSRRMGTRKDYRSANGGEHKKRGGRFRKLKDKLALIFHHHHHHHHHHHGDHRSRQVKGSRGKPLWKHAGGILNRKSNNEAYGEDAAKRVRMAVVHRPDDHQRGHFHALVEGLLRHVRSSNKSKRPKGNNGHGRKTIKKSRWWQMLRRQGRVKMPNKLHVKLGIGSENSPLGTLPKMR